MAALVTGTFAPDFKLKTTDGKDVHLHELLRKGPVVLVFFKVSCPVCQLTLPFLERIRSSGRLPIFAVSQNDADDTRAFQHQFGVALPTLLDSENDGFRVSNAFGISSVPTLFLVEKDCSVSRVIEGWSKAEIESLGALAGVKPFRTNDSVPDWKAG